MVNLFQGLIFCAECGGLMQVAKKTTFKCKKANEKNGGKIEIEYENIYCDRAKTKQTLKQFVLGRSRQENLKTCLSCLTSAQAPRLARGIHGAARLPPPGGAPGRDAYTVRASAVRRLRGL